MLVRFSKHDMRGAFGMGWLGWGEGFHFRTQRGQTDLPSQQSSNEQCQTHQAAYITGQ
jgi:hypothetical protein